MPQSTIPAAVVAKDHELEGKAGRATEALAKHRWHHTLDPVGPQFSFRAYAEAIGRGKTTIERHAKGYELFVDRASDVRPGRTLSLEDAFRLVAQSAEQQEFTEAIAEGSGEPVGRVARGDRSRQRREVIDRAHQRAERRGGNPVDHARDIAAEERRAADSRRQRQDRDRQRHTMRFVAIEGHLAYAQRRLTQALQEAEGVDFTTDELELLRHSIATVRALLNLIDARAAGTPDIDWDAELTRLTTGGA